MNNNPHYNKALQRAAAMCSKQEKCISEIRKKLHDWQLPEEEHDQLINYLIQEKYLDEQRFTESYVKDKFRYNRWGKTKIRYQLSAKQIQDSMIYDALDLIPDEEYEELILEELQKKSKSIKDKEAYIIKGKLMRFGASRGFEADYLYKLVEKVLQE